MAKKGKGPDCPRDSSDKRRWVRKWEPVRGRDAKEVSKSLGGLGGGWPWG